MGMPDHAYGRIPNHSGADPLHDPLVENDQLAQNDMKINV